MKQQQRYVANVEVERKI